MNATVANAKRMTIMKLKMYNEDLRAGCHSSTVAALPDGSAFVVWFQGAYEGASDVAIKGAHITDKFGTNVKISHVVKVNEQAHWNPVISWYNKKLNLFFRVGDSPRNWATWLTTGTPRGDDGILWSTPQTVAFGPVKNKPIQLSLKSFMVAGDSEESSSDWSAKIHRFSPGNNWLGTAKIPQPDNVGMIQPAVWESENGGVHAIMRTTVGELYRSDSYDYGKTWCMAYGIRLPNNNSGVDVVKRKNGELVMIWNPIYSPMIAATRRGVLSLLHSRDNGDTWFERKLSNLEIGHGEYSYPAIIEDEKQRLHITYTLKRKNIVYRRYQ